MCILHGPLFPFLRAFLRALPKPLPTFPGLFFFAALSLQADSCRLSETSCLSITHCTCSGLQINLVAGGPQWVRNQINLQWVPCTQIGIQDDQSGQLGGPMHCMGYSGIVTG